MKLLAGTTILILCSFLSIGQAQNSLKTGNVLLSGTLTSYDSSCCLEGVYLSKSVVQSSREIQDFGGRISVRPDRKGKFNISIPVHDSSARLYLYEKKSGVLLMDWQIIEPGDSIQMTVNINDNGDDYSIDFSDLSEDKSRAPKYRATYECMKLGQAEPNENSTEFLRVSDSLLQVKLDILNTYQKQLKQEIFEVLRADILGASYLSVLYNLPNGYVNVRSAEELSKFAGDVKSKAVFKQLCSSLQHVAANAMVASITYQKFLLKKDEREMLYTAQGTPFTFMDFYAFIKKKYNGRLREKMLAGILTNATEQQMFFRGVNADDFSSCLNEAFKEFRTPWLKKYIYEYAVAVQKGRPAYPFALPSDSTGRIIQLSDFKGKVVLLDIWAYPCTGCTLFSQVFHKAIYPGIKNNSEFQMVSIMVGISPSDKKNYLKRLRGEKDEYGDRFSTYTYPEYKNLFGGYGTKGIEMFNHYNATCFPFVVLIDKRGKIVTTTQHIFTNPQDPDVDELRKLIDSELKK